MSSQEQSSITSAIEELVEKRDVLLDCYELIRKTEKEELDKLNNLKVKLEEAFKREQEAYNKNQELRMKFANTINQVIVNEVCVRESRAPIFADLKVTRQELEAHAYEYIRNVVA
jgi:hypothetical protein